MRLFVFLAITLSSVCIAEKSRTKNVSAPPLLAATTERQTIETDSTTPSTPQSKIEVGFLVGAGITSISNFEKVSRVKDRGTMDFTGGLLVNFNLPANLSIESGFFYFPKSIGFVGQNIPVAGYATMPTLEVPLMVRYWMWDIVSLGVGGYGSYGIGDISIFGENDSSGVGRGFDGDDNQPTSRTWTDAGMHQFDYGVLFGAQLKLPVTNRLKAVLDYRYNLGMRDIQYAGTSRGVEFKTRSSRFLGGLMYAF